MSQIDAFVFKTKRPAETKETKKNCIKDNIYLNYFVWLVIIYFNVNVILLQKSLPKPTKFYYEILIYF